FSIRRRHTSFSRDWSSDVCSSDLRLMQVIEQRHHERQLIHRAAFDQGQNVLAALGSDEEVAVFGSAGNAAVVDQPPEVEPPEKGFELSSRDRREYRHGRFLPL